MNNFKKLLLASTPIGVFYSEDFKNYYYTKDIKKPRGRPRKDGLPPGSVVDLTI